MSPPARVIAVLAAHNRRPRTLAALDAFYASVGGIAPHAVLMDDGSTDGTAEAVRAAHPETTVLSGDGSLFWNRGMAAAFDEARRSTADYFLWLNDDTLLYPDAVARLVADAAGARTGKGVIVAGSTRDPESGAYTYGGVRRLSAWHAGRFEWLLPGEAVRECDSMNGNAVLIARESAELLGGLDTRFRHSMGDFDYGLRARAAGVPVLVGRGYHGDCPRNPADSIWSNRPSVRERIRMVNTPKGLPMREWAYFLRKHGTMLWPAAWLATYRRIVTGGGEEGAAEE